MFCDICDEFDLHETEDCPHQDSDLAQEHLDNQNASKPHRPIKDIGQSERPYCELCEGNKYACYQCTFRMLIQKRILRCMHDIRRRRTEKMFIDCAKILQMHDCNI